MNSSKPASNRQPEREPARAAAAAVALPVRHPTAVAFPSRYCWYVLMAVLDFTVTLVILQLGGREVNGLANALLAAYGPASLLLFKAASVVLVICICEFIARRRRLCAERLADLAIAVTAFPVIVGLAQLALLGAGHIELDLHAFALVP